jgi:hypothetical protein
MLTLALAAMLAVAPAADITTLTGKKLSGDLVSLTAKGVTLKSAAGEQTVPIAELLLVDLGPESPGRDAFTEVELADGSTLACSAVSLQGAQATLTLKSGSVVTCPLANIASILNNAHEPAVRQEWRQLLRNRGQYDLLVIRSDGKLDGLDGTFGPGSAAGDAIEFALASGDRTLNPKLSRVQGLVFIRKPAADAPPVFCKVVDSAGNRLVARSATYDGTTATVELVGGGSVKFAAPARLARFDFSKGKLAYLSDLEPVEVDQSSTDDLIFPYRRDKNLSGSPIRVRGVSYAKGLTLHARTTLTYDIGGDYAEFRCILGVDDVVRAEGGAPVHALVSIEADGRPLLKTEVRSRDEPKPIAVDVKNARRLRITVASPLLDLGNQVTFADARVTK